MSQNDSKCLNWRCLKMFEDVWRLVWHSFCVFEMQAVHTEVLGVSRKYSTGLGVPLPRGCFGIWVFRTQGVSSNHLKAPKVQLSLVLKPVCWDGLGYFRVPPCAKYNEIPRYVVILLLWDVSGSDFEVQRIRVLALFVQLGRAGTECFSSYLGARWRCTMNVQASSKIMKQTFRIN